MTFLIGFTVGVVCIVFGFMLGWLACEWIMHS